MAVSLTLTETQHQQLSTHLFPDDRCEAVAILLCGSTMSAHGHRLVVRKVVPVPYDQCSVRSPDRVTWSTEILVPLIGEAERYGLSIVKIHGHRGFDQFSDVDDASDRMLFPSLHAWLDGGQALGSAILMEDGRCFGRTVDERGDFSSFDRVTVVGDDIRIFDRFSDLSELPDFARRIAQTFGQGTYEQLTRLRIGVVGCSGTGILWSTDLTGTTRRTGTVAACGTFRRKKVVFPARRNPAIAKP